MQRIVLSLAAAAACVTAASSAWADVTAQARLTHFGYRLIDLRPGDGIAPAIRFSVLPGNGGTEAAAFVTENTPPLPTQAGDNLGDGFQSFKPMAVSAVLPGVQARAALSGTLVAHDVAVRTQGMLLNGPDTAYTGSFLTRMWPAFSGRTVFEVTPFTRVVFAGSVSLKVRRTASDAGSFQELALATLDSAVSTAPGESQNLSIHLEASEDSGLREDQYAAWQRFVYLNRGATTNTGSIDLQLGTEGYTLSSLKARLPASVSPVPEPDSAALGLCGLGFVAVAAWRRRRCPPGFPAAAASLGR